MSEEKTLQSPSSPNNVGLKTIDEMEKIAEELRKNGKLLKYLTEIKCPVVAIHGDYDPHPAKGVEIPLSGTIKDLHFHLLKHCGHHPWFEKEAKDNFFNILKQELSS